MTTIMEPEIGFHKDTQKYYISRVVDPDDQDFGHQYMQRDGRWHLWCGGDNYFKTETEAEQFLNRHKDTATVVTGEMKALEEELVTTTRAGIETCTAAIVQEMKLEVLVGAIVKWYADPSRQNAKVLEEIGEYYTEKALRDMMEQNKKLH